MDKPALLALEDGSIFEGSALGALIQPSETYRYALGEVVFNTALTGYQEILSDPSYSNQLVTLTYPHVGNVGVNQEDQESDGMHAAGLIVSRMAIAHSNWRATGSLNDYLIQHGRIGIEGIDTRRLTRLIREKGALKGCIFTSSRLTADDKAKAVLLARSFQGLKGLDLAKEVTTTRSYTWHGGGLWQHALPVSSQPSLKVVVYDFGVKHSILKRLAQLGYLVEVVPAKTPAEEVLARVPSGVLLSNGPGDPEPCIYAIQAIQSLLKAGIPLFGICLGHQLLGLALGAKTIKMKFGHHGANHPVSDETGRVLITSQNHGFAVDESTLPDTLIPTHRSLFDGTLQGFRHAYLPAMGFQGHPEAGPGPVDASCLFGRFHVLMQSYASAQHTDKVISKHAKTK